MAETRDLEDVMKLSIIELYILNYLVRVAGSVVRFSVFNNVHEWLGFETMSRSSFYNSLDKLKSLGYIEISGDGETKDGKKKKVWALPKAKNAIRQVSVFNLWGSIDPDERFAELITDSGYFGDGAVLIISFQHPVNHKIVRLMSGDQTYFLGEEDDLDMVDSEAELQYLSVSHMDRHENFFDSTILYRYAHNRFKSDIEFNTLLEEAIRVTKVGGSVLLLALGEIRTSNNLILEASIGQILGNTHDKQSPAEVTSFLQALSHQKIKDIVVEKDNELSFIRIQL
ncbi:MAG: hypothetical protein ACXAE3_00295 [Candidatus Kariarchaeaceae archaeon]|jgi:hypothetical protein